MGAPVRMARSLLAALALVASACATSSRPAPPASPLLGTALSATARDLSGREVRLAPSGAAVTVLDFWASWCDPCRDQLPALHRLAAAYAARGVAVYAVSFDEERGAIDAFLASTAVDVPVLWDRGGATLAEPLRITRLPTTVVLDQAGVVRAVHVGFDERAAAGIEAEVRRLLGARADQPGT